MRYAIAPNGIFWSLQGEGHLRGFQMAFVRLAGCSVGCPECDTDYSVATRMSADDVCDALSEVMPSSRDAWVWVTGGEPADRDLRHLLAAIKMRGWSTAVATSGSKRLIPPVDWLSVSPHGMNFQQRYGNEIKLVDGMLGGASLEQWHDANPDESSDFLYRYVQPMWKDGGECRESLGRCLAFLRDRPNWSLSRQDHKWWGQP